LTDDTVADAINTLVASNKITQTGAAPPFPRATGVPALLHGDGLEFPRFRGHLSAWPVWAGREDGVHVRAEALHEAVSGGVPS
jgi:hypothetical protein